MSWAFNSFARCLGFTKDSSDSSDEEGNGRSVMIRESVEFYFSDINLEDDLGMRKAIEDAPEGAVPAAFIAGLQRLKVLNATEDDVVYASAASPYLEVNYGQKTVRSVVPFTPDPRRPLRILRVEGFEEGATQSLQREFFESLGNVNVVRITLHRIEREGSYVYTGVSYVELGSEAEAADLAKHGIAYAGGLLNVCLLSDYLDEIAAVESNPSKKSPNHSQ